MAKFVNVESLKQDGIKLFKQDYFDGGIYIKTKEYWYYDGDRVFVHEINSNLSVYTGPASCMYLFMTDASVNNNWLSMFTLDQMCDIYCTIFDVVQAMFDYISKHPNKFEDWDVLKERLITLIKKEKGEI